DRGCGRGAAEIGHVRMARKVGDKVKHFLLEQSASGWGIAGEAEWRADCASSFDRSPLVRMFHAEETITAAGVAAAAAAGDKLAQEVMDLALDNLAEGICHTIPVLCPRRIMIGAR